MHLTLDTMPRSFTSQAYDCIYRNHRLNPPPDPHATGFRHSAAKIARGLVRGFLHIPVTILCMPTGVAYHLSASAFYKVRSWTYFEGDNYTSYTIKVQRASALAFEHFKAAGLEINFLASRMSHHQYSHLPAFHSSSTPVRINNIHEDRSDDAIFKDINALCATAQSRSEQFQKEPGFWQYEFRAKRLYNYDALVASADNLRQMYGKNFPLNDRCVLRNAHLHFFTKKYAQNHLFRVERVSLTEVRRSHGLQSQPVYSVSWKAVAWIIAGMAANLFMFLLKQKMNWNLFVFLPSIVPAIILPLEEAKKAYINHRGKAELVCAQNDPAAANRYWYYKAAMSGYSEAQRAYGLFLLIFNGQLKEGLDLIYAAAVNGDVEQRKIAIADLNALLKTDDDLLPIPGFEHVDGVARPSLVEGDDLAKTLLKNNYIEEASKRWANA